MNTEYKCKCGNTASPFESCPNCEIPEPMNTKQLTYPTIQEQKQFWINKEAQDFPNRKIGEPWDKTEAQSGSCRTNETRLVHRLADALKQSNKMLVACSESAQILKRVDRSGGWQKAENGILDLIHSNGEALAQFEASNLNQSASTTADPKSKDIGGNELPDRIEANQDWYEAERNDFDRGDLRDEGRNPDGEGESYAARNV